MWTFASLHKVLKLIQYTNITILVLVKLDFEILNKIFSLSLMIGKNMIGKGNNTNFDKSVDTSYL